MNEEILVLLKEICSDFAPYRFLKTDMYKGKIIGGHNLYYKKGENGTEGVIIGKRDIAKFGLEVYTKNFITYTRFDQSDIEYGWSGEILIVVLRRIKNIIDSEI